MRVNSWLVRLEWIAALLLSVVAITLHLRLWQNAGPLWRDEISSLNLALAPSLRRFWQLLLPDNFPPLHFLVIRFWTAIGLGRNDTGLRALGGVIGLATIAVTWLGCWRINRRPPLWPLALMGVAALTFQCGDQLRPYGLSALLVTAGYAAFWALAFAPLPTWRTLVVAAAIAILAVQTSYTNSVFIFALGIASAAVAFTRGNRRQACHILGIGALAAISLTPYLLSFSANHRWLVLLPGAQSFGAVFSVLHTALFLNHWSMPSLWAVLAAISLLATGLGFRSSADAHEKYHFLFAGIALLLAALLTIGFFRGLHWQTYPRYFFGLLCFAAFSFHTFLDPITRRNWARAVSLVAALAVSAVQIPWAYRDAGVRLTNVNLIGQELSRRANADDFILLTGFWSGLSFQRYYHGAAKWKSLPDIADFSSYRWDLVMREMSKSEPLLATFQVIEKTLQSGHQVFLVGSIVMQLPQTQPAPLPPAPQSIYGWELERYLASWQMQIGYYLEHHAEHGAPVPIEIDQPVYELENLGVFSLSGYRN